jgi:hypothetical protein
MENKVGKINLYKNFGQRVSRMETTLYAGRREDYKKLNVGDTVYGDVNWYRVTQNGKVYILLKIYSLTLLFHDTLSLSDHKASKIV